MIAANCVLDGMTQQYSDRIHAEFASNFDAARTLANLFYGYPKICYQYGVKMPERPELQRSFWQVNERSTIFLDKRFAAFVQVQLLIW